MSQRQTWEDLYGIRAYITGTLADGGVGADVASVWNSATVTVGNFIVDHGDGDHIGIDLNKFAIPLLNHPTFSPGQEIINNRKAVGTSYRRTGACLEYQMGYRMPTVTYECDATYKILALFFQLLFQGGASEAATTPFLKTYVPYAEGDSDIVACAALIRQMSAAAADSHVIGGAIVRSLTITAEEGQPLKASAEFVGYNMVSNYDFSSESTNILEFDSTACLMYSNATIKLATTEVNLPGFTFTITNNAIPKYYNSNHINKFVLGDFTCTGSFQVPYAALTVGDNTQITNFINGTDVLLQIYWGNETPSATGDVKFELNARYTDATMEGDDEILTTLPFECAHDGTNNAIRCYVADAVDRGIA